jgi:hypothetical protein
MDALLQHERSSIGQDAGRQFENKKRKKQDIK